MKMLLISFLIILSSCATDSAYYPVLQKDVFLKTSNTSPIKNMTLVRGMSYKKNICRGQVLFNSNAREQTDNQLGNQIRALCPHQNYLLEADIKKTWWTVLFYSRSCVELKAYCPRVSK